MDYGLLLELNVLTLAARFIEPPLERRGFSEWYARQLVRE